MTVIRTILAPLADSESGKVSLETAFLIGKAFKAHVTALHVRPDPASSVPLVGEGISGMMVEEMMASAERQAGDVAHTVRHLYDTACAQRDIVTATEPPAVDQPTTQWIEMDGPEEEIIARRGRLFDLVVLGRLDGKRDENAVLAINASLMETGRPVLIAPAEVPTTIGQHIAIAWNRSPEAIRAVIAAMPFLVRAEKITILSTAPDGQDARDDEISGEEFSYYLAWHRLKTNHIVYDRPAASAQGEALLAQVDACGADLLVMGAYTQGRLHNLIYGGVTRHVLAKTRIPVLMRH